MKRVIAIYAGTVTLPHILCMTCFVSHDNSIGALLYLVQPGVRDQGYTNLK